ncbi:hypothetical protein, partial [Mesorhizobium sp.]|uniref:hypothetical protein n=1 Tax=Mesorhizobium sp. TaxID=1871066 RepID=UPI00257D72D3
MAASTPSPSFIVLISDSWIQFIVDNFYPQYQNEKSLRVCDGREREIAEGRRSGGFRHAARDFCSSPPQRGGEVARRSRDGEGSSGRLGM